MAPKTGSKRASSQGTNTAAKRRLTADPAHAKALVVADALLAADAEILPASAAAMLAPLAEVSLSKPQSTRHEFETKVVDMVEEALRNIKEQRERTLEETKAKVDGVFDDKAARQESCERAKAALRDLEAAVPPRKVALAQATAARDSCLEALAAAQRVQREEDKDFVAIEAQRAEVQQAVESLAELKIKSDDSKQSKLAVKAVLDACKACSVDPTLKDPATQVLRKDPGMRSDFDKVVIQQLEHTFTRLIAGFDEPLAAAAPARDERAAAVQAAQKAAEAAEQDVATRGEELCAAQAAAKAGASAVKAAHKVVDNWLKDSKVLMDGFDQLCAQVASLTSGPLLAFEELKDLMPELEAVKEADASPLPKAAAAETAEVEEGSNAAETTC